MVKKIFIQDDVIKNVKKGKCIEGSLRIDAETGQLTFKAFNRKCSKHRKDILICETETGWLKESAQRLKFFSSVKKSLSVSRVYQAMDDDLFEAMQVLKAGTK
jgi:hypothetical protein